MTGRTLGEIRIDRIVEQESPIFEPLLFFPETTEDDWAPHRHWLEPHAMDRATGNLIFTVQSYLIRTRRHTILVDTCVGNHKPRERPAWNMMASARYMDALAALGLTVADIDFVLCTHLHPDHVGWNTQLIDGRWVPTFPNARYVFSRREWEYWQGRHAERPVDYVSDSVLPIVEAGRADLVANDHALDDEMWLEPTPGHTPDHMALRLSSGGADAVLTGDAFHSPIQCLHPEWAARPDVDRAQASRTRRALFERAAESGMLVCPAHFPAPSIGFVRAAGDAFRWEYDRAE